MPWLLRIPSFGTRPLNSQERDLLIRIFGDSINLDPVRVAYIRLISAGTAAYTMGNTILIPVGTSTDTSTLVHEMTHVWPYQTMGTRYISDSALHQAVQGSHAYDVDLVAGQSFYSYAAEPARWLPAKLSASPKLQHCHPTHHSLRGQRDGRIRARPASSRTTAKCARPRRRRGPRGARCAEAASTSDPA